MALVTCPECGKQVSDSAAACPNCGFAVAKANNDTIRIAIGKHPTTGAGYPVKVWSYGGQKVLAEGRSGGVITLKSKTPIQVHVGSSYMASFACTLSPENGGNYRAEFGPGLFAPRMRSVDPVDSIIL